VPVKIISVAAKSPCAKKGIKAGDILVRINGNSIHDILDFQFYSSDKNPVFDIISGVENKRVKLKKDEYQDSGLEFDTYLMDKQRRCANKCIFCFIDQLPPGLRDSLYFKDDDSRLSFLFGNYITLTNIDEREVERIIKMRISPVNISVHTMNPELRSKMMGNPMAGDSLKYIKRFADAGIKMNTQLVLCPGINDGKELKNSLEELGAMYPSVQSIAVVPVGITAHRSGLCLLNAFDKSTAEQALNSIDEFNAHFLWYNKATIVYAADELFISADRAIPVAAYYGDFPQLENGVGMWALLKDEYFASLDDRSLSDGNSGVNLLTKTREISIVTGEAAYPLLEELIDETTKKWHNLKVKIIKIKNCFFGEKITVAGLLTGKDIFEQASSQNLGEELLIPALALRREGDMFLDNMTLNELSEKLSIKINAVPNSGMEFLKAVLGK
jgi:putative radical SAM enzyme (TIGR03279 family)